MGIAQEYKAKNRTEWDARYHVQNLKISMYCALLCMCVRLAGGQKLLIGKLMLRQSLRAQGANKGIDNGILTHTRLHIFVYTHTHTQSHTNAFIYSCLLPVCFRLTTSSYNNSCSFFLSSFVFLSAATCQSEFKPIVFSTVICCSALSQLQPALVFVYFSNQLLFVKYTYTSSASP